VISLIFDKAVLEPTFCAMYAQLCVHMSKELPEFPVEQAREKPTTFRRVLLNTCQEEFEGADALREEIKKLTKPEQALERDEKEKRVKLRTLGNIKLIGELFKQKMLLEKIVHTCIQELLGQDPNRTRRPFRRRRMWRRCATCSRRWASSWRRARSRRWRSTRTSRG
jgi:translation initiation factor 4G